MDVSEFAKTFESEAQDFNRSTRLHTSRAAPECETVESSSHMRELLAHPASVAAEWCGVVRNAFLILPAERNDTAAINSKLTTWNKSAQNRNR